MRSLVWLIPAWAFLTWVVVKARARGRRLFRDEPWERVDALRPNVVPDHSQDVLQ